MQTLLAIAHHLSCHNKSVNITDLQLSTRWHTVFRQAAPTPTAQLASLLDNRPSQPIFKKYAIDPNQIYTQKADSLN